MASNNKPLVKRRKRKMGTVQARSSVGRMNTSSPDRQGSSTLLAGIYNTLVEWQEKPPELKGQLAKQVESIIQDDFEENFPSGIPTETIIN